MPNRKSSSFVLSCVLLVGLLETAFCAVVQVNPTPSKPPGIIFDSGPILPGQSPYLATFEDLPVDILAQKFQTKSAKSAKSTVQQKSDVVLTYYGNTALAFN